MNSRGKEFETIFHLIYLGVLTVFGVLLAVVGTLAGGEDVVVVIEIILMVLIWAAHLLSLGTANQRIYFYTIAATLFLMYYGSHPDSITDMPLVLCLMLIVLSVQEDMGLIYLISISYPLMVLHHIFVTRYISLNMDWIVLSRVVLGVICVAIAVVISRFFIRSNESNKAAVEELEEEVKQAEINKKELLANVSHELRTPINVINGMSEMMLKEDLKEPSYTYMQDINIAGHRIYRQVTSILDYSEIITDQLVVEKRDYAVTDLMDASLHDIMEESLAKGVSITAKVEDNVPAYLYGDEYKIYRIIVLLLENAYKFTNYGSIDFKISAREESYGVNLIIDITDTGVGMTKKAVEKLMQGAFKEDSASNRSSSGIGIGFTIANQLAKKMKGFIQVESELGAGTHVRVCIPQELASDIDVKESKGLEVTLLSEDTNSLEESEQVPAPALVKAEEEDKTEGLRVLIIDDELMNLKVVRGMLSTFDIKAKIAESGSEGLALCELEDFDLIFLDYMMPEMDGEETMYRIRAARNGFYQKVPIVALTANAASGARQMFLDMGFDEFLAKPVDSASMGKMLETVNKMLVGGGQNE